MKVRKPTACTPLYDIDKLSSAHIIRRSTTTLNKTVSALDAKFRWCLTGTPIQNRLEDIGALFSFIRTRPFHNLPTFRRFIVLPFDESDANRIMATRSLSVLIDSLCLWRTRELLKLPENQSQIRYVEFSEKERQQYKKTQQIMSRVIRQPGREDRKNVFGMFQTQLQLRILCNHGTFQHLFSWASPKRTFLEEREDALCSIGGDMEIKCSLCKESMPIIGSKCMNPERSRLCAHVLCSECWNDRDEEETEGLSRCPLCLLASVPSDGHRKVGNENEADYFQREGHSSKMAALITDVQEGLWGNKR